MFQQLSNRLSETVRKLSGKAHLSEENIQESLREVRIALLEADVALPVVKDLLDEIKTKALGQDVLKSLSPGQALIKIVRDELTLIMGDKNDALNLAAQPPAAVLMLGLQGSGKTTTAAKLARKLKLEDKKKVMLASLDVYRPAAIDQLKTLSAQIDAVWFPSEPNQQPVTIARNALDAAKRQGMDVVILDTAGRLHIDDALMDELKAVHAASNPIESLLVVDSMTGQDAVNVAKAFHDLIPVTGLILTKTDGDARGGAALSIRKISGTPVKFLGIGEKIDALEAFHPDRVVSRILGMGDVLSLIEEAEKNLDKEAAQKAAKKIKKGQFDLEDFREQIQQMHKMGGLGSILGKLPGMGQLPMGQIDEKMFSRYVAIINSMTPQERRYPDIIKGSRKRRIASGCGLDVPEINRLLKQFAMMQKMMKKFTKPGTMKHMMRQFGGMMPPK
jgi:signal recognition particle subunit SRP54